MTILIIWLSYLVNKTLVELNFFKKCTFEFNTFRFFTYLLQTFEYNLK